MTLPIVSGMTAGAVLILQMALMSNVASARARLEQSLGDGGKDEMQRVIRRHGNLAENSGLFIAGFALLELLGGNRLAVIALCAAFVGARVLHVLGLSRTDTNNNFRGYGAIATAVIGIILGCYLILISVALLATA